MKPEEENVLKLTHQEEIHLLKIRANGSVCYLCPDPCLTLGLLLLSGFTFQASGFLLRYRAAICRAAYLASISYSRFTRSPTFR